MDEATGDSFFIEERTGVLREFWAAPQPPTEALGTRRIAKEKLVARADKLLVALFMGPVSERQLLTRDAGELRRRPGPSHGEPSDPFTAVTYQRDEAGLQMPSHFDVLLNAATGRVEWLKQTWAPAPASLKPTVSRQEAIETAADEHGVPESAVVTATLRVHAFAVRKQARLEWQIRFRPVETKTKSFGGAVVEVDAHTGRMVPRRP